MQQAKILMYSYVPFLKASEVDAKDTAYEHLLRDMINIIVALRPMNTNAPDEVLEILKKILTMTTDQNVLNMDAFRHFSSSLEKYKTKVQPPVIQVMTPKRIASKRKPMSSSLAESSISSTTSRLSLGSNQVLRKSPRLIADIKEEPHKLIQEVEFPINSDFAILSKKHFVFKKVFNVGYAVAQVDGSDQLIYQCFAAGCPFTMKDEVSLLTHIQIKHEKLQWNHTCELCEVSSSSLFVSSIFDELKHMKEEHIDREPLFKDVVIKFVANYCPAAPDKLNESAKKLLHCAKEFVKPINCPACKEGFALIDVFFKHVETDHGGQTLTCKACKIKINLSHMETCFKVGMFQCLHCIFASNSTHGMKNHLLQEHRSLPQHYCVRIGNDSANPKSFKSLTFKSFEDGTNNKCGAQDTA